MSIIVRVLVVLVAIVEIMGCSEMTTASNRESYTPTTTYNPVTYRPESTYNPYTHTQPVYSRFYSQGANAGTNL